MTRKSITMIFLVVFVYLIWAYAREPQVTFATNADFMSYRAYTWVKGTAAPDAIIDQVIIPATEYELRQAWLRYAETWDENAIQFEFCTDAPPSTGKSTVATRIECWVVM